MFVSDIPTQIAGQSASSLEVFGKYSGGAVLSIVQRLTEQSNSNRCFVRRSSDGGANWSSWKEFAVDYPAFYKDYADFAALSSALGISRIVKLKAVTKGTEVKIGTEVGVFVLVDKYLSIVQVVLNAYNTCTVIGEASPLASRKYTFANKNNTDLYATLNANSDADGVINVYKIG